MSREEQEVILMQDYEGFEKGTIFRVQFVDNRDNFVRCWSDVMTTVDLPKFAIKESRNVS